MKLLLIALSLVSASTLAQPGDARLAVDNGLAFVLESGTLKHNMIEDMEFWTIRVHVEDGNGLTVAGMPVSVSGCRPNKAGVVGQFITIISNGQMKPTLWTRGGPKTSDHLAVLICSMIGAPT